MSISESAGASIGATTGAAATGMSQSGADAGAKIGVDVGTQSASASSSMKFLTKISERLGAGAGVVSVVSPPARAHHVEIKDGKVVDVEGDVEARESRGLWAGIVEIGKGLAAIFSGPGGIVQYGRNAAKQARENADKGITYTADPSYSEAQMSSTGANTGGEGGVSENKAVGTAALTVSDSKSMEFLQKLLSKPLAKTITVAPATEVTVDEDTGESMKHDDDVGKAIAEYLSSDLSRAYYDVKSSVVNFTSPVKAAVDSLFDPVSSAAKEKAGIEVSPTQIELLVIAIFTLFMLKGK
jgi:hypothetical protein